MNRRLTLLTPLLVSLILIAFTSPIHADTEIAPTIVVDTVDPATLMPGDTGTVTIALTNGAQDEVVQVTEIEAFGMNAYVASAPLASDKEG